MTINGEYIHNFSAEQCTYGAFLCISGKVVEKQFMPLNNQ